MNPLDALSKIALLSQSLDRTFTAPSDAKLPQLEVGQSVNATVEEALQNGNFRVTIAGQSLQMSLPQGTKAGDTIRLIVVEKEPRLTFKLDLPQAAQETQLSPAGRLISQILPDAAKPSPPLTSSSPVLPSPLEAPKTIAHALQSTLSESGLFYESHQAQWVMGERSLDQLKLEPQNLPQAAEKIAAELTTKLPLRLDQAPDNPALKADGIVKHDVLPVVRHQIETLETREFNWTGQIWPGQNMDWQVKEDEHRASSAAEIEPPAWNSRLRLTLPELGEVDAGLRLAASGVQITIKVAKPESESRMKAQVQQLQTALQANGIQLLSIAVKQHG